MGVVKEECPHFPPLCVAASEQLAGQIEGWVYTKHFLNTGHTKDERFEDKTCQTVLQVNVKSPEWLNLVRSAILLVFVQTVRIVAVEMLVGCRFLAFSLVELGEGRQGIVLHHFAAPVHCLNLVFVELVR